MARPLHDDGLTDGERRSAEAQIEFVLSHLGIDRAEMADLIDALRWLRAHRAFIEKLQAGSVTAIVSITLAALASALWAGVKSLLGGQH